MKRIFVFLIAAGLLSVSCKRKMTREEIKERLEKTMTEHLLQQQEKTGKHDKFKVKDVNWFEMPGFYACKFEVELSLPDGRDTTGIMKGNIAKDFSEVK